MAAGENDPRRPRPTWRRLAVAALATGTVPVALGFGAYWMAPWGCDANAWACLLPLCLIVLGPAGAIVLPVGFLLNRRRVRPLPDGSVAVAILSGVAGQAGVSAASLWLAAPHVRDIFLWDILIVPQGFVAGLIVGAVFGASLGKAVAAR